MTHRLDITTDEQVKILKRARGLINSPSNWVMENWKCEVTKVTDHGCMVPVTNENGTPLYQYCIEGAINQATYDVLGEDRALALGAVKFNENKGELEFAGNDELRDQGIAPAGILGLNDLAQEQYGYDTALEYNDSPVNSDGDVTPEEVHEGVIHLLTTRLNQLAGRKDAA